MGQTMEPARHSGVVSEPECSIRQGENRWWDNGSLLLLDCQLLRDNFSTRTAVYVGVGKEGLAPCETPHVMEVDANLLAEKLNNAK